MTLRRDLTIMTLTFCLTASLLMIIPIRSQYSTQELGVYDPWRDLNDDGSINLFDCVMLAEVAGTSGTPINKTDLLLYLNNTVNSLLARIDALNAIVIQQQNTINNMNNTINYLNDTAIELNETVIELNGTMGQHLIRFLEPNVTAVSASTVDVACFYWIPENSSNNALLSITFYAQYRSDFPSCDMRLMLWVSDEVGSEVQMEYDLHTELPTPQDWKWTVAPSYNIFISENFGKLHPNQPYYKIKVTAYSYPPSYLGYIRNVNVIASTSDGTMPKK